MGRFSRKEAESKGWIIVHEDENQGFYRAEKAVANGKVEASGITEGKLLESINAYEAHLDSLVQPEPLPVDESGIPVDEAGFPLRTVIVPGGVENEDDETGEKGFDSETLTEAEWSRRGAGDVIAGRQYGPSEAAAEADAERQEIAAEKENRLKADPRGELDVEQIEQESLRDHQLQDVLLVREGEGSLEEVIDRKLDDSAKAESERVAAGLGIGPPSEEPMGGTPSIFDPSDLPAGVSPTEEPVEARQEAQEAKALELRDEHGKAADKPELAGEVAEAGAEAEQEVKDEAEEAQEEAPEATPAAEELAAEENVDLSQVKGSGKGGKVTKPDVEKVASEGEGDAEK